MTFKEWLKLKYENRPDWAKYENWSTRTRWIVGVAGGLLTLIVGYLFYSFLVSSTIAVAPLIAFCLAVLSWPRYKEPLKTWWADKALPELQQRWREKKLPNLPIIGTLVVAGYLIGNLFGAIPEYVNGIVMATYLVPLSLLIPLFIIGPFIAPALVNTPFRMEGEGENAKAVRSRFGFFTELEPGDVKIIELLGRRFVTCIMRYPGHTFRCMTKAGRHLERNTADAWFVEKTPPGEHDVHAIPLPQLTSLGLIFLPVRYTWWLWQRLIYTTTGLVWSGFWPFMRVRTYPIEYFEEITSGGGKFTLKRKRNYSDHYRVQEFDFFIPMESADTEDFLPLQIVLGLVLRVANPWLTAYNTDRNGWSTRLFNVVPSKVNDYTRGKKLSEILTTSGRRTSTPLYNKIKKLGQRDEPDAELTRIGVEVTGVHTPDRSVADISVLNDTAKRLADRAVAVIDKDARITRAEGDARAIELQTAAIAAGGEYAELAAQIDGDVRIATAAGQRAIITLGGRGGDDSTTMKAILAELRAANGGTRNGGDS